MIRVGVVGLGHWGPNLVRCFKELDESEVVWGVDPSSDNRSKVSHKFPNLKVSANVEELLADDSVDAIAISTPTVTHHGIAKEALKAKKHVLVEKPITSQSGQAAELMALAEEHERCLMVGHVFVYNNAVRAIKEYIDHLDLGRIYYISMTRTNLGPIRGDVNAAWDLAAHDISIANYWLNATPVSVSATGSAWINEGVEDAVFGTLRYPNNTLVHLVASWLNPRKVRDIVVTGERQMVTFDDLNPQEPIRIYDKCITRERLKHVEGVGSFRASLYEGAVTIPKIQMGEPLKDECRHFLSSIAKGSEPLSGAKEGLDVVLALEALQESLQRQGAEVEVRSSGSTPPVALVGT